MSAITPVDGQQPGEGAAESRRERMKRAAIAGIDSATPRVKEALHAAATAVESNAGQCGALAADGVQCLLSRRDGEENGPDPLEGVREPVSECCATAVGEGVESSRPHIDPAVDSTAACASRTAERGIDCVTDSGETCAQGTSNLRDRVTGCF